MTPTCLYGLETITSSSSFGLSHQGSPQRIFLLQLFLSTVSSSVTSTSAMSSFTTITPCEKQQIDCVCACVWENNWVRWIVEVARVDWRKMDDLREELCIEKSLLERHRYIAENTITRLETVYNSSPCPQLGRWCSCRAREATGWCWRPRVIYRRDSLWP